MTPVLLGLVFSSLCPTPILPSLRRPRKEFQVQKRREADKARSLARLIGSDAGGRLEAIARNHTTQKPDGLKRITRQRRDCSLTVTP